MPSISFNLHKNSMRELRVRQMNWLANWSSKSGSVGHLIFCFHLSFPTPSNPSSSSESWIFKNHKPTHLSPPHYTGLSLHYLLLRLLQEVLVALSASTIVPAPLPTALPSHPNHHYSLFSTEPQKNPISVEAQSLDINLKDPTWPSSPKSLTSFPTTLYLKMAALIALILTYSFL